MSNPTTPVRTSTPNQDNDDCFGPPAPREKMLKQKKPEEIAADEEWGTSDEEPEYESVVSGEEKSRVKALTGTDPAGPAIVLVDKLIGLAQQEANRLRKASVYITNESSYVLVNPHWAFKNGKTEKNPEYVIRRSATGEAVFQGHTLKGMLTYEIATPRPTEKDSLALSKPNKYALMILFKVLYFRGFEVKLFDLNVKPERKNQAGVKVVAMSEFENKLKGKVISKGGIYHEHKKAMKHCEGVFHPSKPDTSKYTDAPNLVAHFSISDTGEADVKIVVQDGSQ